MIGFIRDLQRKIGGGLQPFVLLLLRLIIGYGLFRTGWGKLGNLEGVTEFFDSLGIPAPGVNAKVVAFFETACGLLIMAGLVTRIASAIGIGILTVAIITYSKHIEEVSAFFSDPASLIGSAPVPYIMLLLVFGTVGAGKLSADHLLTPSGS